MDIITKQQARDSGLLVYFTGKPCKHGHISERYSKGNGECVQCCKEKSKKWYSDKERANIKSKNWSDKNPGRKAAATAKHRAKDHDRVRAQGKISDLKRRTNDRDRMNTNQRNRYFKNLDKNIGKRYGVEPTHPRPEVCEICGKPETAIHDKGRLRLLSLDHDHKAKEFRGWLCHCCNVGLGNYKDNPELLRKAADYLENFNKNLTHTEEKDTIQV